jgi:hypothetical protein
MKIKFKILIGLLLILQTSTLFAYPGESIIKDANGDYIITYWNGANMMYTKFVPATKIDPSVNSVFKLANAGFITYRYTIANDIGARQPITQIVIGGITRIFSNQPSVSLSSITTTDSAMAALRSSQAQIVRPNLWNGLALPDPDNSSLVQVGWDFSTDKTPNAVRFGIPPGSKQNGFGFASVDLPGIGKMVLWGESGIQQGYEDEGPDSADSEIIPQLEQIEHNNFVSRNSAAPLISVPSPFNAAILLGNIQTQMHTWIRMQLLDTTFSSQLDRYLSAAADAYRHNQPKVVKEDIEKIREMLKREHQDLGRDEEHESDNSREKNDDKKAKMIDRLAAQVLDFDLQYVLKRMDKNHDTD